MINIKNIKKLFVHVLLSTIKLFQHQNQKNKREYGYKHLPNGVSAEKRDQTEIFFKKKFLSQINADLFIRSRTFITLKKIFLSVWSLFSALTPYGLSMC